MAMRKNKVFLVLVTLLILLYTANGTAVSALYAFTLSGEDDKYFQEVLDLVNDAETNGKGLNAISGAGDKAVSGYLFCHLDTGEYLFNTTVHKGISFRKRRDVMKTFRTAMNDKPFSVEARQKVYNALLEQDDAAVTAVIEEILKGTSADLSVAVDFVGRYGGYIRTGLGVFTYVLIAVFMLSVFIDVLYINFPLLVNAFPPEKRGLASKPARAAVIERSSTDGTDANVSYFKKRFPGIILFSVVIMLMVTGRMADFILWIARAVL